jgi:hypothetical protein
MFSTNEVVMDTTDIKEFPDVGGPPELAVPDGTLEERKAWWKAVIERAEASPLIEGTVDELFDRVKRRGRERLEQSKHAA